MKSRVPTVVVPTDFSPPSKVALEAALNLADALGAEVHVIYVRAKLRPLFPHNPENRTAASRLDHEEIDAARAALKQFVSRYPRVARARVLRGIPHVEIVAYAEQHGADYIVIGSSGRGLLGSIVLGSTTERVLRSSHTPVVVVPNHGKRRSSPARTRSS